MGPRLEVFTADRTWDSYDLIAFLRALPRTKAPRVAALDDAGFHASKAVRSARKGLADVGIHLAFLPPHSPERNRIEPVLRQIKPQEIPIRSCKTRSGMREAVDRGFAASGRSLLARSRRE